MAKKINFCLFVIGWLAKEFFNYEAAAHKFSLVRNKTGKSWKTGTCPKCGFGSALVGRSHADKEVYIALCGRCKKHTIRRHTGLPPVDGVYIHLVAKAAMTCKGTKTDGTACTYVAKDNGYCGVHAGQAVAAGEQKPLF